MCLCLQTEIQPNTRVLQPYTKKRSIMNSQFLLEVTSFISLIVGVLGHGRLISPPGRSTMWRYGYHTPKNYNDNQMFCGGFNKQWNINGGRCGVCGDPWNGVRENEAGGKYATGQIVGHYKAGQTINVKVLITATHRGYFEFRLCPVNNLNRKATQACLDRYLLKQTNGQSRYSEPGSTGTYSVDLQLPRGLTCSQCVLQWKWNTGNSYNCDKNQRCCVGCGPQEQFYGCADIAISSNTGSHSQSHPQGGVVGYLPITSGSSTCKATALFKSRYRYADRYCLVQCGLNKCPSFQYCTNACRNK